MRVPRAMLAAALALPGCAGPGAAAPGQPAGSLPGAGMLSNDGSYYVVFSPAPRELPMNELFEMDVRVLGGADRAPLADDVELRVDAAMPEHRHGMATRPRVTANPDGSFTVEGMLLHMPGYWELYFDVTRGGITERAQVSVDLE